MIISSFTLVRLVAIQKERFESLATFLLIYKQFASSFSKLLKFFLFSLKHIGKNDRTAHRTIPTIEKLAELQIIVLKRMLVFAYLFGSVYFEPIRQINKYQKTEHIIALIFLCFEHNKAAFSTNYLRLVVNNQNISFELQ